MGCDRHVILKESEQRVEIVFKLKLPLFKLKRSIVKWLLLLFFVSQCFKALVGNQILRKNGEAPCHDAPKVLNFLTKQTLILNIFEKILTNSDNFHVSVAEVAIELVSADR